ncbi:hypothetical protein V7S79_07300 [Aquirufa sp. ROCK-SH2]
MKKLIAIALLTAFVVSSCSQSTNCPAYGTTRANVEKVRRI